MPQNPRSWMAEKLQRHAAKHDITFTNLRTQIKKKNTNKQTHVQKKKQTTVVVKKISIVQ